MSNKIEDLSETKKRWLEEQQLNSWNPEIIISGLSLAFIFSFPYGMYTFVVFMIQEWGMSFLAGLLLLFYSLILLNVFKIFLIIHLSLRFAWASLLGISYAFPAGVAEDKLFDYQKVGTFFSPQEMVLRLERICSMAFGIPLNLALIFIPITIILSILVFVQVFFKVEFFVLYLIFMGLLFAFGIYGLMAKKLGIKAKGSNMLGSISAIYSSNLGKWKYNLAILGIFVVAIPLINADSRHIFRFFNQANYSEDYREWNRMEWFFEENRGEDERISRFTLPTYETYQSELQINIAHYEEDVISIGELGKSYSHVFDTMNWKIPKEIPDLYKFYLNDTLVSSSCHWEPSIMPVTEQKVFRTCLDISSLKPGNQQLRVEKLVLRMPFFNRSAEVVVKENWGYVRFYKK